jgi:hypothetical protein
LKASPIEKSQGLYKYMESKPADDILKFINALQKSGNYGWAIVFSGCGFHFEYHSTPQPAQQDTSSSSRQPLCNQPSTPRPRDSATETNPGKSGNYPTPMSCKL